MPEPSRVVVFPGWRDNPYLNLMYLATAAEGVEITYPTILQSVLAVLAESGPETVLHLHWTAPVAQDEEDEDAARRRVDAFTSALASAQRRGVRVVWTVHNVLPHELRHRDLELALCRHLAATVDLVHVMLPGTADVVAEEYSLPADRTVQVPHPSYQGLYAPREADRAEHRAALGVPEDRRSVLFFGQMRPYKGIDTLLGALGQLVVRGEELPTVLLAGSTPDGVEEHVTSLLPEGVRAVRAHRFISDAEVERWFGAADVAVFPYRSILNSGSVHLAATMGVPAVIPGATHLVQHFADEPWLRYLDPQDPVTSLADVLATPETYHRDVEAMRAFSDRLAPWRVSGRLRDVLTSV